MESSIDELNETVEDISEKLNEIKGDGKKERDGKNEGSEIHERSNLKKEDIDKVRKGIEETREKLKENLWDKIEDPHSNYPGFQKKEEEKNQGEKKVKEESEKPEDKKEENKEKREKREVEGRKEKLRNLSEGQINELKRFQEKMNYAKNRLMEGDHDHLEDIYRSLLKDYRKLRDRDVVGEKEKNLMKKIYSHIEKY